MIYTTVGQFITVNWWLLLIMVALVYFGATEMKRNAGALFSWIVVHFFLLTCMRGLSWFVGIFQPVTSSTFLAYLLNFFIGLILFLFLIVLAMYRQKKKRGHRKI